MYKKQTEPWSKNFYIKFYLRNKDEISAKSTIIMGVRNIIEWKIRLICVSIPYLENEVI